MDYTPLLFPLLVGIAAVAFWRLRRRGRSRLPYSRRDALLTPAELRFYRALLRAVPDGLAVFVKVRLMDVVNVPDDAWATHGARGSGMHCDFVLALADTTAAVLVVELDDRSHWQAEARRRDAFKDSALRSAGVPLVRVRAAGEYDAGWLRARILVAIAS